MNKTAAHYKEI